MYFIYEYLVLVVLALALGALLFGSYFLILVAQEWGQQMVAKSQRLGKQAALAAAEHLDARSLLPTQPPGTTIAESR